MQSATNRIARSECLAAFCSTMGRPSVDPELMLRMLIVGYRAPLAFLSFS